MVASPPEPGHPSRVTRLGSLAVLLAVAAVNVPWLTCDSACQDATRALSVFVDHHCHDHEGWRHARADEAHGSGCAGCCGTRDCGTRGSEEAPKPGQPGQPGQPRQPDEPGDHEVRYHPVVRSDVLALLAAPVVALLPTEVDSAHDVPRRAPDVGAAVRGTGPPPERAGVRLLL